MAGPQLLARSIAKLTAAAVGRKHPDLAGLMQAWPDIVGPDWAGRASPLGWHRRRGSEMGKVVLELGISPGAGLLVQHESPVLLSRINGYFGHKVVAELRLTQLDQEPIPYRPSRETKSEPVPGVDNSELAAALGGLGAAIRESARKR
jgi:hypothetical protein